MGYDQEEPTPPGLENTCQQCRIIETLTVLRIGGLKENGKHNRMPTRVKARKGERERQRDHNKRGMRRARVGGGAGQDTLFVASDRGTCGANERDKGRG
jgi:hypothetical protein